MCTDFSRQTVPAAREKLIVALDFATPREAEVLVTGPGDTVSFYKIGLELAYGGGIPFARDLMKEGKQVFLDLKLHDIPATVRACAQVAGLGANFLTVHAYPQTMKAAKLAVAGIVAASAWRDCLDLMRRSGPRRRRLCLWGPGSHGAPCSAGLRSRHRRLDSIGRRSEQHTCETWAQNDPCDPWNLPRRHGCRRPEKNRDTAAAIAAGADYLVVGRPVTQAKNPREAAETIVAEIASAMS